MPDEQPLSGQRKFDWKRSPDGVREFYANFLHVAWTLFDIRIQIGQLMPEGADPSAKFYAEERAGVTMSWAQAKGLRDMLIDVVKRYENVNGEIEPIILPTNTKPEPER